MYSVRYRPYKANSALLLGYLMISTTLPFMFSYRESMNSPLSTKGTINARALFNKI
ncbi:unnamed protein product [Debaryomyces fabryi]|nr:unnamed protein product [Debaryomyces fabryi]